MKILAIESSSLVASVAVLEDSLLKGEFTINNKLTHSETLLPMVKTMLEISGIELSEIDAIAVSAGPGSFTGLRIGAATAKGLALALNIPLISVSTLFAMAYNQGISAKKVVCPIMDARRGQIYGAAYREGLTLIEEGAHDIHVFLEQLNRIAEDGESWEFVFLGDGVPVNKDAISEEFRGSAFDCERIEATAENNRQRAASVGVIGMWTYRKWLSANGLSAEEVRKTGADHIDCFDETVMNSDHFAPDYMRKTQAEREMAAGLLEDPGTHSLKKIARGER